MWDIVNGENLNESKIRLSLPTSLWSGLDKMSRELEIRFTLGNLWISCGCRCLSSNASKGLNVSKTHQGLQLDMFAKSWSRRKQHVSEGSGVSI